MKLTARAALFTGSIPARLQLFLFVLFFAGLQALSGMAHAQATKPSASAASAPVKAANSVTAKPGSTKPSWADLTPMQQTTLQPLAASWPTLSEAQKRKWLEISKNYPTLPSEGQATMHSRMNEWAALSPAQRAEARLNFAKTKELSKQLTPEEKKAKWQTYQALTAEEKQKLASKSTSRPVGAAPAVKPVAPQKLAAVPPHGSKPAAKIMEAETSLANRPPVEATSGSTAAPHQN